MHSILLIEDDETIREATRLSLQRDGFQVDTAPDGEGGLVRFRATRPRGDPQSVLRSGQLEIDTGAMEVRRDGELVSLTPTEYKLLLELAENPGIVLSREQLLENVWGYVWSGDTRLVDMHVQRIRGEVGADAVETVRGAGEKLGGP